MYGRISPFREGDTFATFRNLIENVGREIDALDNDYILKASETELENYYVSKVLIEPLLLDSENYYVDNQQSIRKDVSHDFNRMSFRGERIVVAGTQLDIAIHFTGDPMLWRIRASTFSLSGYPEISIDGDKITFSVTFADDSADPARLKQQIESNVKSLADAVNYLQRDVENHNRTAPNQIKAALERKKQKAQTATNALAGLGIPFKRKDNPPTFTVPTTRRVTPAKRPPKVPTEKYAPEPVLDMAEYEHILEVIKSMGLVIERSPSSFATLDEEAIRTHFLLQLNGHYEGSATGETFNAVGKTDILIRVENKNIFIAECKFWRGPKGFSEAIDQLLSYLSWRDSKCALLIFNKNKDSSAVRDRMHVIMASREEHRRTLFNNKGGDSRYIFVKTDDPGKEIIVTTQLFDIPDN
jgi:hypothetical protein